MPLIRSAAHLHMCVCGLHAHIIYADKSISLEFGSREAGLDIVEQALKDKKLASEEGCAVIEQIIQCHLPTERSVADEALDDLRAVQDELGSVGIEVFLSTSRPTSESARNQGQLES